MPNETTAPARTGWIIGNVLQTSLMAWAAIELWGSLLSVLLLAVCGLIALGVLVRASKAA